MSTPPNINLTLHQKRVLAALRALEERHLWSWWDRGTIGEVVGSSGYHGTIQVKTMRMLKELDLIQTEDSSWPDEVRRLVRCNCACCQWGLTDLGRDMVATMNVRWSSATEKRIASAYSGRPQYDRVDEDEFPQYGGGDLDYENE